MNKEQALRIPIGAVINDYIGGAEAAELHGNMGVAEQLRKTAEFLKESIEFYEDEEIEAEDYLEVI